MDAALIQMLEEQFQKLIIVEPKGGEEWVLIRNGMFEKISPSIAMWIKGYLSRRKKYISDQERLSLCWDCFEFCLDRYRPDNKISIPSHFYGYTRFFLMSWFAKNKKYDDRNWNVSDNKIDHNNGNYLDEFYGQMDDLKTFRKTIPNDYQAIFDDALLSMAGQPRDRAPYRKSDSYGYYKYCESKKVFKLVIDFLLRR